MGWPLVIAGGIAALSQAFQSHSNRKAQKESNRANEKLAREQRAWNEAQWRRQNEYNDPANAIARLQGAGLNPQLQYEGGLSTSAGNAGDVRGYDRAENKAVQLGNLGLSEFTNGLMQSIQADNVKKQTELYAQEELKKIAETINTNEDAAKKAQDRNFAKELHDYNMDFQKYAAEKMREEYVQTRTQRRLEQANYNTKIQQATAQLNKAIAELEGQNLQNKIAQITYELNQQGVSWNDPQWQRILIENGVNLMDDLKLNWDAAKGIIGNARPKWMK